MGTIGDSYDNAMAESLWASLKKELIYRRTFSTREEARTAIFAFINWYNKGRDGDRVSLADSVRTKG
jgi:transposase InsO family protein